MPATPARIGFITNELRRSIAGPDAAVVAKYGTLARDTEVPVETFFDSETDAQAMANERLALLSPSRRLLTSVVQGAETGLSITFRPAIPTAQVIDDERAYNKAALGIGISIDFENGKTEIQTWG